MTSKYHHTQIGWVVILFLGAGILIIALVILLVKFNWIAFGVLLILLGCLFLFPTLTVKCDEQKLEVRFGLGLIRKRLLYKDIHSCKVVKNLWIYGFGIRLIPSGWMFNVSGLSALELQFKNGKKFRIGTDDSEKLFEFVNQKINK